MRIKSNNKLRLALCGDTFLFKDSFYLEIHQKFKTVQSNSYEIVHRWCLFMFDSVVCMG